MSPVLTAIFDAIYVLCSVFSPAVRFKPGFHQARFISFVHRAGLAAVDHQIALIVIPIRNVHVVAE